MTTALTILGLILLPMVCSAICAGEKFCQGDENEGSPLL